jgi:hypothetical protein
MAHDAAEGLEPVQLSCEGGTPPRFGYTTAYVLGAGLNICVDQGCGCCASAPPSCAIGCPCAGSPLDGAPSYTATGRPLFMETGGAPEPPYLAECGPGCSCSQQQGPPCRPSQTGLTVQLSLRDTPKGWAGFAGQAIARGTFVCNYLGEPVSTPQAASRLAEYDRQGAGHALLVGGLPMQPCVGGRRSALLLSGTPARSAGPPSAQ